MDASLIYFILLSLFVIFPAGYMVGVWAERASQAEDIEPVVTEDSAPYNARHRKAVMRTASELRTSETNVQSVLDVYERAMNRGKGL